jgi:hypothetical protein
MISGSCFISEEKQSFMASLCKGISNVLLAEMSLHALGPPTTARNSSISGQRRNKILSQVSTAAHIKDNITQTETLSRCKSFSSNPAMHNTLISCVPCVLTFIGLIHDYIRIVVKIISTLYVVWVCFPFVPNMGECTSIMVYVSIYICIMCIIFGLIGA